MKRMKIGLGALVIAILALTIAVAAAQPPGNNGNGGRGQQGLGLELQVIANTLGIDVNTLQSDLQNGQTIADLASAQNVELSTIIDAIVAQRTEQLTQSVTDGQLTQAQADAQIALLKANLTVQLTQSLQPVQSTDRQNPPPTGTQGDPRQGENDQLTIIAGVLGIDVQTLQTDLQNGQTIADIASAQNVELSTITDAVVAQRTATLSQAVADGTLTQEQADAQILVLKANLNALYTQTWDASRPFGGDNGNGRPMGPGGNGGAPDQNGNGGPMGPGGNGPMGSGGNGGNPPSGNGTPGTGSNTGSNA